MINNEDIAKKCVKLTLSLRFKIWAVKIYFLTENVIIRSP